jgi:hypothetical protein
MGIEIDGASISRALWALVGSPSQGITGAQASCTTKPAGTLQAILPNGGLLITCSFMPVLLEAARSKKQQRSIWA